MAGKVQTSIEKKGQLTLAMKKFIVDQRETKKTDINEIIRRVYNEFQVTTSKSAVYRILKAKDKICKAG
jgi:uncharacterized protein YpuA (DUF1002 family)